MAQSNTSAQISYLNEETNLKGKHVLLRVDFNVPIIDGIIQNDFRIRQEIPTIELLQSKGAKIILISHLTDKNNVTLEPVARALVAKFPRLYFITDIFDKKSHDIVDAMKEGDIVLFENLRQWPGEESNSETFADNLASFADVFVNDAFAVSHRPHASIVGLPKRLPSYCGPLLETEIKELSKVFSPKHPFLFILGGAKFETKLPLIQKYLKTADNVFVGGALAHDIFKTRDLFVGDSLVADKPIDLSEISKDSKLIVPVDVVVRHKGILETKTPQTISVGDNIIDAGPKTLSELKKLIDQAEFILWNGPIGMYIGGFKQGTLELAQMIAQRTSEGGSMSIIGGGDTLASIDELGIENKFSFVSTGGGAMLDFLADETLVGIDALKK